MLILERYSLFLYQDALESLLDRCRTFHLNPVLGESLVHKLVALREKWLLLDPLDLLVQYHYIALRLVKINQAITNPTSPLLLWRPEVDSAALSRLIQIVLMDQNRRERALNLSAEHASHLMNLLQMDLDVQPYGSPRRSDILRLMQDISDAVDELPSSYWLLGVTRVVRLRWGAEADIWKCNYDGADVAAREVRFPEESDIVSRVRMRRVVRREILAHRQLRHPHILPLIGVFRDVVHPLSIITPLMINGNASDYLHSRMDSDRFLKIIQGTADGLRYLHGSSPIFVHGDIRAPNVLVTPNGDPLLCDFGLTRIRHEVTRAHSTTTEGGSERHMAPELYEGDEEFRTTPATDCYAFSMTILELGTLQPPLSKYKNARSAAFAAARGTRPEQLTSLGGLPAATTKQLWEVMVDMWSQSPEARPTMPNVSRRLRRLGRTVHPHTRSGQSQPTPAVLQLLSITEPRLVTPSPSDAESSASHDRTSFSTLWKNLLGSGTSNDSGEPVDGRAGVTSYESSILRPEPGGPFVIPQDEVLSLEKIFNSATGKMVNILTDRPFHRDPFYVVRSRGRILHSRTKITDQGSLSRRRRIVAEGGPSIVSSSMDSNLIPRSSRIRHLLVPGESMEGSNSSRNDGSPHRRTERKPMIRPLLPHDHYSIVNLSESCWNSFHQDCEIVVKSPVVESWASFGLPSLVDVTV